MAAALDRLAALSDADQRAILSSLDDSDPKEPLSAAEKMRRYRARRRLAALIAGSGSRMC